MSDETMRQNLTRWECRQINQERRYFWARPDQAYCPFCKFNIPEYHNDASGVIDRGEIT